MYSQNNEEQFILDHFGDTKGRFLDIGAYDGRTFSNTLALVERGWSGVCVEPSPSVFVSLLALHRDNPNIQLVNAAIGFKNELVPFYDSGGDAVSSTVEAHRERWSAHAKFAKFHVYTITLADIWHQFGWDYSFINIDVEGMSAQLFMALPLIVLPSTKLICVEHDGQSGPIIQKGAEHGFRPVTMNAENVILAR